MADEKIVWDFSALTEENISENLKNAVKEAFGEDHKFVLIKELGKQVRKVSTKYALLAKLDKDDETNLVIIILNERETNGEKKYTGKAMSIVI